MPKRHGFFRDEEGERLCSMGIWRIFDPFTVGPYCRLSQKQGQQDRAVEKPMYIEFHFRKILYRLFHSLDLLQKGVRSWSGFLEAGSIAGPNPTLVFTIPLQAGIAAYSVFHYLNMFIDDIAKAVPFALFIRPSEVQEVESFSDLKAKIRDSQIPVSPQLRALFEELDRDFSWWCLGFQFKRGIRQRLVHYTDILDFSGSAKEDHGKMVAEVRLVSVGEGIRVQDFEKTLRELLYGLCEWLDKLEEVLIGILDDKMAEEKIAWDWQNSQCPKVILRLTCELAGEHSKQVEQEGADLYLPLIVTQ